MEEKIVEIIKSIDEDIVTFTGKNLLEDGIIDSFGIMEIVATLEEELEIEIKPELITVENFRNIETIISMVLVSKRD